MTVKSKTGVALAAVIAIAILAFLQLDRSFHFTGGHGKVVDELIARNVAARGGAEAWRAVDTLRFSGRMDLGQDLRVPYVLEQKRPGKMCFEFEFDDQTATQCVDGRSGWKLLPFMGRNSPQPMTEPELREMAGAVSIDGLLFDSDKRGYRITLVGNETVDGRDTSKLEVKLPTGAVRWVYVDNESGLEVKMEAMRSLRGQERLVSTTFSEWRAEDGLLIPHRQETHSQGDAESHFVTVEDVSVNPPIDDERFAMPGTGARAGNAS
jgi:hypothetical protein